MVGVGPDGCKWSAPIEGQVQAQTPSKTSEGETFQGLVYENTGRVKPDVSWNNNSVLDDPFVL